MAVLASLHARSVSLTVGRTTILHDIDLSVAPGWKVGLVGPNGVGKSTLLKILAGLARADDGAVSTTPPHALVGYLPQEPERRADESVRDFLTRRTGVGAATRELEAATIDLAGGLQAA